MKKRVKKKVKSSRGQKIVLLLLIILFVSLLLVSIFNIFIWNKENKENKDIKKSVNAAIELLEDDKIKIDWKKLKEQNSDAVAYIKINNTNIDYVIVKTDNNDYYLNHNFDKKYSDAGWIFINYKNTLDGNDKNISIFGHARLDGSMFGSLKKTFTKEWQENPSNYDIIFITEGEESTYKVFSTYRIKEEDYYIKTDFSDNEYAGFINTLKERSNYNYNVEVGENDKIITLSTCDIDDNYRIVLHAKKI